MKKRGFVYSGMLAALLLALTGLIWADTQGTVYQVSSARETDLAGIWNQPGVSVFETGSGWVLAQLPDTAVSHLTGEGFVVRAVARTGPGRVPFLVRCSDPVLFLSLEKYGPAVVLDGKTVLIEFDEGVDPRDVIPVRLSCRPLRTDPLPPPAPEIREAGADRAVVLEANPSVSNMVAQVSQDYMRPVLERLVAFGNRDSRTANATNASEYIRSELASMGYVPTFQTFTFEGYSSRNVLATLPGSTTGGERVLVCAHYDSVSVSPGADDNGSGTAAVLQVARIFAGHTATLPVDFVLFSAEENGLYGSAKHSTWASQQGYTYRAVLNLDMVSFSDVKPEDLDLVCNSRSSALADRFAATTATYVPGFATLKALDSSLSWSDHASYWSKWPALCLIEDTEDTNPYYHTKNDTIDKLDFDFFVRTVRATTAMAATEAGVKALSGDLDGSGVVDIQDVMILAVYLSAGGTVDTVAADLDGDGSVDARDLTSLISRLVS